MKKPSGIRRSLVALLLCLASVITLATVSVADDNARTGLEVTSEREAPAATPAPTETVVPAVTEPVAQPPAFDADDPSLSEPVQSEPVADPEPVFAIRLPGGDIVHLNDLSNNSDANRTLPVGTANADGPTKLNSDASILRAEEQSPPVPPQPEPTATPTATATPTPTPTPTSTPPEYDPWLPVRMCESTNTYTINTGNGYYGAYQFSISTWNWVAGIIGRTDLVGLRPDLAAPADQDAMADALAFEVPGGGLHHWPVCGRLYGS